jgi:hypothetical protein
MEEKICTVIGMAKFSVSRTPPKSKTEVIPLEPHIMSHVELYKIYTSNVQKC